VSVQPVVSAPKVPKTARRKRAFTVSGTLGPKHAAGSRTVTLKFYRYEKRRWVLRARTAATNSDFGAGSKYSVRVKLSRAGSYKVVAEHVGPYGAPVASAAVRMKVR